MYIQSNQNIPKVLVGALFALMMSACGATPVSDEAGAPTGRNRFAGTSRSRSGRGSNAGPKLTPGRSRQAAPRRSANAG